MFINKLYVLYEDSHVVGTEIRPELGIMRYEYVACAK